MLQDLYSGFKKVAEDNASATLEHENGHKINIAKNGLNRKQLKQLGSLPLHQASGSEKLVQDPVAKLNEEMLGTKEQGAIPQESTMGQYTERPVQAEPTQQGETAKNVGVVMGQVLQPVMAGVANAAKQVVEGAVDTLKTPLRMGEAAANVFGPVGAGVIQGYTGKRTEYTPTTERNQPPMPQAGLMKPPVEPDFTAAQPVTPELQAAQEEQQQKLLQAEQLAGDQQFEQGLAAPTAAQQSQRGVTAAQPGQSIPGAVTGAPTAPLAPAPLPSPLRDQKEVMFDAKLPTSERMAAAQNVLNDITKRISTAEEDFRNKLMSEDINPDRVFENMSTGRKIRTILGVLLAGAGSGLAGGENLALTMLNREIERDVEAQKLNKEKKFNLFKMHLETLGNERAATLQTMNNMRDIADMRIKEIAQNLDPKNIQAKSALEAAIAKNQLEKRKAHEEMATLEMDRLWKEQNKLASQGVGQTGRGYEPKEYRERGFDVVIPAEGGKLVTRRLFATNASEAAKAKEKSAAIENVRETYNRIVRFNLTKGRAFGPAESGEAETLNEQMGIALAGLATSGVNEKTIKAMGGLAPKAGAWKQSKQAAKNIEFNRYINAQTEQLVRQFRQ